MTAVGHLHTHTRRCDHRLQSAESSHRDLNSLREKLIKIGAKVVGYGRYLTFQMAEVTVSRQMFNEILSLIARLRAPPVSA
jgi:hypothetical protein